MDWVLKNVLFLHLGGEGDGEAGSGADGAATGSGVEFQRRWLDLFPVSVSLGGRKQWQKVQVCKSPFDSIVFCNFRTNEQETELRADTLLSATRTGPSDLKLRFGSPSGGDRLEMELHFKTHGEAADFEAALENVLHKKVETAPAASGAAAGRKKAAKRAAGAGTRHLTMIGNGLFDDMLTLSLDAGDAAEDSTAILASLVVESGMSVGRQFPFDSVKWTLSEAPGGVNTKYSAVPCVGDGKAIRPTALTAGYYVMAEVTAAPSLARIGMELEGSTKIIKGPILPSSALTQHLLELMSRGSTVCNVAIGLPSLLTFFGWWVRVKPAMAAYHDALARLNTEWYETELHLTNQRLYIVFNLAKLPPYTLSVRWEEMMVTLEAPVDEQRRFIPRLTGSKSFASTFSTLSPPQGAEWVSLDLQSGSQKDRDLLYHAAWFFFVNRGSAHRDFHRWATNLADGNSMDLQYEFRKMWQNMDWSTVSSMIELSSFWSDESHPPAEPPPGPVPRQRRQSAKETATTQAKQAAAVSHTKKHAKETDQPIFAATEPTERIEKPKQIKRWESESSGELSDEIVRKK